MQFHVCLKVSGSRFRSRKYTLLMSTNIAKHDTKKIIIELIESGHRASHVAESLKISKSTISRLLKRWRIRGDTENLPRTGRKKTVTKRSENTLSRVVKSSRRATLKDITGEFNARIPVPVSRRTVQQKLHFMKYTRRSVRKKNRYSGEFTKGTKNQSKWVTFI